MILFAVIYFITLLSLRTIKFYRIWILCHSIGGLCILRITNERKINKIWAVICITAAKYWRWALLLCVCVCSSAQVVFRLQLLINIELMRAIDTKRESLFIKTGVGNYDCIHTVYLFPCEIPNCVFLWSCFDSLAVATTIGLLAFRWLLLTCRWLLLTCRWCR